MIEDMGSTPPQIAGSRVAGGDNNTHTHSVQTPLYGFGCVGVHACVFVDVLGLMLICSVINYKALQQPWLLLCHFFSSFPSEGQCVWAELSYRHGSNTAQALYDSPLNTFPP